MSRIKRDNEPPRTEEIIQKTMEDVMHDSMMPYSEYVILERALPRVEDGLKPVQRRILYTMHELGITPDKPYRKCARIVGDCLGKYHPHGDTSVYDALARMAQSFVMRACLVDGHGNFGSIDGDSPAAMRYTEARMAPQALLLLQDIEKNTVNFHLNFDDSLQEPDLLPARFPNLLVNGASGIAVGLATNIPTHNLGEVIDGVVALIDDPRLTTSELMRYIPGPDFPTGGIVAADAELFQAYETGRGKLSVRAKTHFENGTSGRKLIVIDEIPYQINKAALLERILRVSEEKKTMLAGIHDIRDESDRSGMRAVVELKRDVDPEKILNILFKYTDLQTTFGVNMVAIADGKPKLMGLKQILRYYIDYQKQVVTRRTQYELDQAESRAHILEGLIIAVDNLDEVIRLIRGSRNPREAKTRLMERFQLSDIQAQAILDMRLQRLTNLEVLALRREYEDLQKLIQKLKGILKSESKLMAMIKKELEEIRSSHSDARRTQLSTDFGEIVIEKEKPVAEEISVVMTGGTFLKRMNEKLLQKALASGELKDMELDVLNGVFTDKKILFFTDRGNCHALPAALIPDARPKDRGIAIAGLLAGLEKDERVIAMLDPGQWTGEMLFATKQGMLKRTALSEYDVRKSCYTAVKLKKDDELVAAVACGGHESLLLVTRHGMAIHFAIEEVSVVGRTAAGVKGITLSGDDSLIAAFPHDSEGELIICTDTGYMKRCLLIDFERQARGGKGVKCITLLKNGSNGSSVAGALTVTDPYDFMAIQKSGTITVMNTEEIALEMRSSKGTPYIMAVMNDTILRLRRQFSQQ